MELEGAEELSAVFCFLEAEFRAGFCLFIDLFSHCLATSSACLAFSSAFFLAAAYLSALFWFCSNFRLSFSLLVDGVPEKVDDRVVVIEPGVSTRGQADLGDDCLPVADLGFGKGGGFKIKDREF